MLVFLESKNNLKLFHLSTKSNLGNSILIPQSPSIFKNVEDDNILENKSIPRISMSSNIEGCLNGLGHLIRNLKNVECIEFFVYTNKNDIKNYFSPSKLTKDRLVFDAHETNEYWVLEPTELKKIGKFKISIDNIDFSQNKPLGILPFNDTNMKRTNMYIYQFKNIPNFKTKG